MKQESVQLATAILDGSIPYPDINPKGIINVQRAKFEMKGEKYDPKMKPKKLGKKEKERLEKKREKMLAWEPEKMRGERSKREKVVVIKNVFDKVIFEYSIALTLNKNYGIIPNYSQIYIKTDRLISLYLIGYIRQRCK